MGKKIICCLAVLLCVLLALCGCNDVDTASDTSLTSSINDNSSAEDKVEGQLPRQYDEIINNIVKAYPWDDDDLEIVAENPELSYMYRRNTSLSQVGFALVDLDNNGQAELIISNAEQSTIYDLYTIVGDKAVHIFAGGERNAYSLYENGFIENIWSGSAVSSGNTYYKLNGEKIDVIEMITLDAYHALELGLINDIEEANDDNTFFISKSENTEDYRHVSADEALQAIDHYKDTLKPLHIEYTLLSEYN